MSKSDYHTGLCLVLGLLFLLHPALAAPPLPDLPIPQNFGVNTHFLDEDLPDHMRYLKQAGFGWIRRDLYWDAVEKHAGVYAFTAYDRLVTAAQENHIRIVFILDYSNPLYDQGLSPSSAEGRAAFARFAAAAAKRYADKDIVWEIYNEPNWAFWKPAPDVTQYIALANEVTAAIRQAVPEAIIIGPALAGPTADPRHAAAAQDFLGKVLQSPAVQEWSAITVHPYRDKNATPESAAPQLAVMRGMMRDAGITPDQTPLIAGEWGYSTWLRGVDENTQAAYAVREMLEAMAEHMPFSIWYDWQDDGDNPFDAEHRFGLLRAGDLSKAEESAVEKPAFVAVKQLANVLNGYRFAKRLDATTLVFAKGDQLAYVLLSDTAEQVGVTLSEGGWVASHLLEESVNLTVTKDHSVVMAVDKMPVIIVRTE